MGVKWTREQEQVIRLRGKNLLVSAAAGSGKTAVLVERILSLVTDPKNPIDVDELLIVTFTRAAAGEMRERIGQALQKAVETDPDNDHLQRQQTLLHHAQINTIHGFCSYVIQNYFQMIDLDPAYRMAEDGEIRLLRSDVVKEVLEEGYTEQTPEFANFIECYAAGKTDEGIEDLILNLFDFASSYPWPEEWLAGCLETYEISTKEELEAAPWMQYLMREAGKNLESIRNMQRETMAVLSRPAAPVLYEPMLQADLEQTEALLSCGTYETLQKAFGALAFPMLSRKKDPDADETLKETVKTKREETKKLLKGLQEQYFSRTEEEILADTAVSRGPVKELIRLTLRFAELFAERKRKKNLLDYSDLEHFALKILLRKEDGRLVRTEAAKELARQYREIMIDEYQDSNFIQEALLSAVSGEEDGVWNRFMVGDIKQSIYGFRLARPELFLEKYRTYQREDTVKEPGESMAAAAEQAERNTVVAAEQAERNTAAAEEQTEKNTAAAEEQVERNTTAAAKQAEGDKADTAVQKEGVMEDEAGIPAGQRETSDLEKHCRRIDLHKNFRSREQVLETSNYIFRRVMCEDLGGIAYDDAASLYPGAVFSEENSFSESAAGVQESCMEGSSNKKKSVRHAYDTEILLLDRKAPELEDDHSRETMIEAECHLAAARIRELVGREQVLDRESGTYRPASYRDIVILLRTVSGWAETFQRVLQASGIPAYCTSRTGYFSAREVVTVLNYLQICDNPMQEIPFTAVLRSPMVGCSAKELAELKCSGKEQKIYEACAEYAENGADETLRGKLREFLALLEEMRRKVPYTPIHELLTEILERTGYSGYAAALPGGEQRKANLQMLIEKAVDFESTSYRGLFHFVRYIQQLQKYEVDFGEVNIQGETADTVRIMSIHKSKGLEFPIVFVSGMGKKFNQSDSRAALVLHSGLGIGADVIRPERREKSASVQKQVLRKALSMENLAEEMRVLYVALTRAKEKLILTGAVDKLEQLVRKCASLAEASAKVLPYPVLSSASTYLDWVLPAMAGSRCMIPLYEKYEMGIPEICLKKAQGNRNGMAGVSAGNPQDPPAEIRCEQPQNMVEEELLYQMNLQVKKEELLHLDPEKVYDPGTARLLDENFSFRYPFEKVTELPAKMTVSELKRAGEEEEEAGERMFETQDGLNKEPEEGEPRPKPEEDFVPIVPAFMQKEEKVLQGAARGTAYHKILECLDFTKAESEEQVQRQLEALQEENKMSREEADSVRVRDLVWLAKGMLGQRMKRAYQKGRLYTEQPFVMAVPASQIRAAYPEQEEILVQGIIDAYFEESDGLVIVDYKTDWVPDRNGQILVERYQKQLWYYREALERLTGKKVKKMYLYSFSLGKALECV